MTIAAGEGIRQWGVVWRNDREEGRDDEDGVAKVECSVTKLMPKR